MADGTLKLFMFIGLLFFSQSDPIRAGDKHDIHVCLTEVRWNPQTLSFEVAVKLFIDDLELALGKENVTGLFIGTPKESKEADSRIFNYIQKHFHISLDGVRLPGELLGKEVTEDYQAIWCYIEFEGFKSPKQCTISNNLLFELYDDQRNIMDIRMTASHKAYTIFEPERSSWNYTF